MITVDLVGGLGNNLFILATGYCLSKSYNHDYILNQIPLPPSKHSNLNYSTLIFKNFNNALYIKPFSENINQLSITENNLYPIDLKLISETNNNTLITLNGYFQNYQYLKDPYSNEFINLLDFPDNNIDLDDSYFLHIRRGDYVAHSYHELNLDNYYKKALSVVNERSGLVCQVLSNDIKWCRDYSLFDDYRVNFVEKDEIVSLDIMRKCKYGGISANSSFSWWGLYMNRDRENLIVPDKWYPHNQLYVDGYYHPSFKVISI